MPILHYTNAGLVGFAIATLVVCAIVAREVGWRSAAGAFFIATMGMLGVAIAQLIRADASTISRMDVAVRLMQSSVAITIAGTVEVFAIATNAHRRWLHYLLQTLLLVCAGYAAWSAGGMLFQPLQGVQVQIQTWGEVIHVPQVRAELGSIVILAAGFLCASRILTLSLRSWSRSVWLQRAVMFGASVAFFAALLRTVAQSLRWLQGPTYFEPALLLLYVVAAFEAFQTQRRWSKERLEAISRVRESEGKLSAILSHGQTLAGLLSPDGQLVMVNRSALDMLGAAVTAEEVVGRPFVETPWWTHSSALQQRLAKAIEQAAGGVADAFRATQPRSNGKVAEIDFSLTPYHDKQGDVCWLIAEGHDVTKQVRFEQRAREEQRLEVIGQLASGIAHDFNNMLTGILGAAEFGKEICHEPEVCECLDLVIEASNRAAVLTRQLLSFARRGEARLEGIEFHLLVASTVSLFARMAGPQVSIAKKLLATHDGIVGDPALLQSMLMNLLINAKDAMPSGGTITIATELDTLTERETSRFVPPSEPGQYLRVSVSDTGSGIPAEVLSRIFEPFYTTKEIGKGTGLGLAAVLGCVRDHGGAVNVSSEVGKGTTFALHLPLATRVTARGAINLDSKLIQAAGKVALIVDDEPIVRDVVARLLVQLGFHVESAENGAIALERLGRLSSHPTLALVDLHMPMMDGQQLSRLLVEQQPPIPVVLCSGNFGDADLGELRTNSRVRLLAKPLRREELIGALLELGVLQRN